MTMDFQSGNEGGQEPPKFTFSKQSFVPPSTFGALEDDEDLTYSAPNGDQDEGDQVEITLEEAPIPHGEVKLWSSQNRTLLYKTNPATLDGLAWVGRKDNGPSSNKQVFDPERKLYPTVVPEMNSHEQYTTLAQTLYGIVQDYLAVVQSPNAPEGSRERELATQNSLAQIIDTVKDFAATTNDPMVTEALYIMSCMQTVNFTPSSIHNITQQFVEWVNSVDAGWSTEDTLDVMKANPVTDHPAYWELVCHQAVRGLKKECASILREAIRDQSSAAVPAEVAECIEYSIQLLRTYPDGDSVGKYNFRQWRQAALELKAKVGDLSDADWRIELERLLGILTGDFDVVTSVAQTWYEGMCTLLNYAEPSRSRLAEYCDKIQKQLPPDSTIAWEMGSVAAIKGNILQCLQSIESLDLGLATTMSQFCKYSGLLDNYELAKGQFGGNAEESITDWLYLSYAQQCLCTPDLSVIGVEMLQQKGTKRARQMIAEALPRIVGDQVEDIQWAEKVVTELGLDTVYADINRAAGMRYIGIGEFVDAFVCFERASDVGALRTHGWKLFEEIISAQRPPQSEITTEALEEQSYRMELSPLIREVMAPSGVVLAFIRHMEAGDSLKAVHHLISLLNFPHIPSQYRGVLIAMVLPLISRQNARVMAPNDLVAVMTAIDAWQTNSQDQDRGISVLEHSLAIAPLELLPYDWRYHVPAGANGQQVIRLVRIQLAREMSRAYLEGA